MQFGQNGINVVVDHVAEVNMSFYSSSLEQTK